MNAEFLFLTEVFNDLLVASQREPLAADVARIRTYPLLQKGVSVAGAIHNVSTGRLEPVDC